MFRFDWAASYFEVSRVWYFRDWRSFSTKGYPIEDRKAAMVIPEA